MVASPRDSQRRLSICFVLPGSGYVPIGGFKVVYEYANRLGKRGHDVTIVHAATVQPDGRALWAPMQAAKYVRRRLTGKYRPNEWFCLSPKVSTTWVPSPHARYVPDADVVVATAWQTAEWVGGYPTAKGRRFYLVQHLETWAGPEDRVIATWRLPLHKIVIARWLSELATTLGESADYIPNGLDFTTFGMDRPPEERDAACVLMLYHTAEWKGSRDGVEALRLAKIRCPALRGVLFGTPERPRALPVWIEYYRTPPQSTLRQLYNRAAVFLAPSWSEGCAAPPGEAMICGTAVVATDIGGHHEYAIQGETAILAPPKDPTSLAEALVRMVNDHAFRQRLAWAGNAFIQQFTWERASAAFEHILQRTFEDEE